MNTMNEVNGVRAASSTPPSWTQKGAPHSLYNTGKFDSNKGFQTNMTMGNQPDLIGETDLPTRILSNPEQTMTLI